MPDIHGQQIVYTNNQPSVWGAAISGAASQGLGTLISEGGRLAHDALFGPSPADMLAQENANAARLTNEKMFRDQLLQDQVNSNLPIEQVNADYRRKAQQLHLGDSWEDGTNAAYTANPQSVLMRRQGELAQKSAFSNEGLSVQPAQGTYPQAETKIPLTATEAVVNAEQPANTQVSPTGAPLPSSETSLAPVTSSLVNQQPVADEELTRAAATAVASANEPPPQPIPQESLPLLQAQMARTTAALSQLGNAGIAMTTGKIDPAQQALAMQFGQMAEKEVNALAQQARAAQGQPSSTINVAEAAMTMSAYQRLSDPAQLKAYAAMPGVGPAKAAEDLKKAQQKMNLLIAKGGSILPSEWELITNLSKGFTPPMTAAGFQYMLGKDSLEQDTHKFEKTFEFNSEMERAKLQLAKNVDARAEAMAPQEREALRVQTEMGRAQINSLVAQTGLNLSASARADLDQKAELAIKSFNIMAKAGELKVSEDTKNFQVVASLLNGVARERADVMGSISSERAKLEAANANAVWKFPGADPAKFKDDPGFQAYQAQMAQLKQREHDLTHGVRDKDGNVIQEGFTQREARYNAMMQQYLGTSPSMTTMQDSAQAGAAKLQGLGLAAITRARTDAAANQRIPSLQDAARQVLQTGNISYIADSAMENSLLFNAALGSKFEGGKLTGGYNLSPEQLRMAVYLADSIRTSAKPSYDEFFHKLPASVKQALGAKAPDVYNAGVMFHGMMGGK